MQVVSTPVTVATGCGILTSAVAAGIGTSLSLVGIPTILNTGAPLDVMLRQWRFQFLRGRAFMPITGVLTAANYLFVAYSYYAKGLEWRGFAAAGLSTFSIIPFTLVFIMKTNSQLLAACESSDKKEKTMSNSTATALIKKWGELNAVRQLVPLIGTGLALWNLLR
ncbi:hypothetical protein F4779DRAFT_622446 [Xylariaceae sp. FL0662B]|nr:hypothetical protein F4779DRAFT_622446 [Xylariaceae sp. FL0662B]